MKAAFLSGDSRWELVQGACHHSSVVLLEASVCAVAWGSESPWGSPGGGCATGCGREAGCEEGALRAEHAATVRECACACRAVALPRAHRLWANSWVPPHSPAQAVACSL